MAKRYLLLICLFVTCLGNLAKASVTVIAATGGTNICASKAIGGTAATPTILNTITVWEGFQTDLITGTRTLTLVPPAGWQFNTTAPSFSFTTGRNITAIALSSITSSALTITVSVSGMSQLDTFRIVGLRVQASSSAAAAGNIRATSFTGFNGISTSTNFGSLSLIAVPNAVTVSGAGTYCDSETINASVAGAGIIYYEGLTSGGTSTASAVTSQLVSMQGTHTFYFRAASSASCWGPEGSAVVTINNSPGTIFTGSSVSPAAICMGDSVVFLAYAGSPIVEILQQDFNSGLGSWTITNLAGTSASYFQIVSSPGYSSAIVGDGSPYIEAAPDVTGSPSVPTNTIITSPSFSLAGYVSATLTFNQYYRDYTDTSVSVEYSIDGGASWTTIVNQAAAGNAGATSWLSNTANLSLAMPSDALGVADVRLRWNYNSPWGWYWAIDNIAVNGIPDLAFNWAGVSGASGLSCSSCDTTVIMPTLSGTNIYSVSTSVTGCVSSASVSVDVTPLPSVFNVLGGGAYCAGGMGEDIALDNSEIGVNYQLYNSSAAVGTAFSGTGTAIDFGILTGAGVYSVMATNASFACSAGMNDSAVIDIVPLPVVSTIIGNPTVCMGANQTLTDTTVGGLWTSSDPSIASVGIVSGIVSGISLGNTDISYTVTSLGCSASAVFNISVGNPMPSVTIMPSGATLCHGNPVSLAATSVAVAYQWAVNGSAISGAINNTYTADSAGYYSVTLDNGTCTLTLPAVHILASPSAAIVYNTSGNYLYTGSFSSYQWMLNGIVIAGATSSIYPLSTSGIYNVVVTDVNGCTDTSSTYSYTAPITGVANVTNTTISIYPNPASSVLHIVSGTTVNVAILSPDGRVVINPQSRADINIAGLAEGVYIVMIYDQNNTLLKTDRFSKMSQ